MANVQLQSKTKREDLPARQEYYFQLTHKGLHLGFRRSPSTGCRDLGCKNFAGEWSL